MALKPMSDRRGDRYMNREKTRERGVVIPFETLNKVKERFFQKEEELTINIELTEGKRDTVDEGQTEEPCLSALEEEFSLLKKAIDGEDKKWVDTCVDSFLYEVKKFKNEYYRIRGEEDDY